MRNNKHLLNLLPYDAALINSMTTYDAFYWARSKICQGKHTDAVRMICDAVLFELRNNPTVLDQCKLGESIEEIVNVRSWPQLGAVLEIRENTPSITFSKETFKPSEAVSYYRYFQSLLAQLATPHLKSSSWLRRFWFQLKGRLREDVSEFLAKSIPDDIEAWPTRIYADTMIELRYLCHLIPKIRQVEREIEYVGYTFHEPLETARKIHKDYTKHLVRFRSNDWRAKNVDGYLEEYVDSIVWEGESDYQKLLDRHRGKSRVLTTFHFGFFRNALLRLGKHVEEGRTNITVTQYEDTYEQRQARSRFYRDIKENYRQYTTDQLDSRLLVKELRAGNTAVTLLFDMPAKSGESVEVLFFGRKARFAKGTAHIAITARVPIFPVFAFEEAGNSHLVCREVIDTSLLPGETFDGAVQRITQSLVRMAEEYLSRYPHQWMLLNKLESYFIGEHGVNPEDV